MSEDEKCFGEHFFYPEDISLGRMDERTMDNRNRFVNFAVDNDLIAANTLYRKKPEKTVNIPQQSQRNEDGRRTI